MTKQIKVSRYKTGERKYILHHEVLKNGKRPKAIKEEDLGKEISKVFDLIEKKEK